MNYINVIERYNEYQISIHELMASIIEGVFDESLFHNEQALQDVMKWISIHYPFVELIFTLDKDGVQNSKNIANSPIATEKQLHNKAIGINRSYRPYFLKAKESTGVFVTSPYLSSSSHKLCISAAIKHLDPNNEVVGVLVIDINLSQAIEFLMGDAKRKKFHPFFVSVYSCIVVGLFVVVALLLYSAGLEFVHLFMSPTIENIHLKSFGIIIFLTLALAIFDLGKTTIEEEVLMHKDILRHSSTRRTITRFIATILIAVSIEALLLMFKSVLGHIEYLANAVAMMGAAVGLLIGLGIYVYLGAKAEAVLKSTHMR